MTAFGLVLSPLLRGEPLSGNHNLYTSCSHIAAAVREGPKDSDFLPLSLPLSVIQTHTFTTMR